MWKIKTTYKFKSVFQAKTKIKEVNNMELSAISNNIKQIFIVKFSLLLPLLFVCSSKFYCIYFVI